MNEKQPVVPGYTTPGAQLMQRVCRDAQARGCPVVTEVKATCTADVADFIDPTGALRRSGLLTVV